MIGQKSSRFSTNRSVDEEMVLELTSLLDVIFILLLFFILTSGITQIATEVQLPRTAENLEAQANPEPVLVEIFKETSKWKFNGTIFNDFEQLKTEIVQLKQAQPEQSFLLAPEATLPVERLLQLLNFLSAQQISNIQIISEWSP